MLSTYSRLAKFDLDRTFAQMQGCAQRSSPTQLPVDVTQTASHYIVRADVPGFTREQIGIEAHEGVLTITAARGHLKHEASVATENARAIETTVEVEQPVLRERVAGTFARRLAFNEGFVEDQTVANLTDGVLTITLAKLPTSKPHRVTVK